MLFGVDCVIVNVYDIVIVGCHCLVLYVVVRVPPVVALANMTLPARAWNIRSAFIKGPIITDPLFAVVWLLLVSLGTISQN